MMLRLLLLCLLARFDGAVANGHGVKEDKSYRYQREVGDFLETYLPDENGRPNECKNDAYDKGHQYNGNKKERPEAVAMVNLYTQQCYEYKGAQDKPFYWELNAQIRNANGILNRGDIWGDASYLLSKALSILPKSRARNLYRGCECPIPESGDRFSFTSFASTSLRPAVADSFTGNQSFFHMRGMSKQGVRATGYSYFRTEAEVLLDKMFLFEVTRVVKNATEARNEVKKIYNGAISRPTAFVELRPDKGKPRRWYKRVLCGCF